MKIGEKQRTMQTQYRVLSCMLRVCVCVCVCVMSDFWILHHFTQ